MNRFEILPDARIDFDESFDWYDERSEEAATRFAHEVDDAYTRILRRPMSFALIDKRHRACTLKNFPFRVVFRFSESHILVVAIAHAKRRPKYWRNR